jgi:hypothetical protein
MQRYNSGRELVAHKEALRRHAKRVSSPGGCRQCLRMTSASALPFSSESKVLIFIHSIGDLYRTSR